MKISLPDEVIKISRKLKSKGFEIYIVGGAVRDILMGKIINDWDFATNATPDEILKIFKNGFYDNKFGTVGIPAKDPDLKPHEITTFRTEEGYSDSRRPDKIKWGKSLTEDLNRRDFTINAMAIDPTTLSIIDPFNGQKDIQKKLIRAVGDPNERIKEDALRLLRALRIASQLGFSIEDETFNAIKSSATLINKIAKERIKDELFKILISPNPIQGITLMRETNLLKEILPEAEKMFGVDQVSPQRHHIYDVGTHALMSLKSLKSNDPVVALATFIHDIGKPQTYKKTSGGIITFYNHEIVGAKIAKNIASRLRLSKKEGEKLYKLVRYHQFTVDENQSDKAIKRFIRKVGLENVEDMLELRRADRLGSGARETSWRTEEFKKRLIEVQKTPFTIHDLKITGHDVMKELGIKPGPKVGEILETLFKEVEDKKIDNKRGELLKRLKELA